MDAGIKKRNKPLDRDAIIKVINEELISKSIAKQRIVVDKISLAPSIVLSFKHIRTIENLQGFTHLRVLKLDNNNIKKIENLTSLVTLEVLDLSFNQITEIPKDGGLETLVNLKELSLFANKIKEITNLASLQSLQILSLGDNEIEDVEKLKPLRALKNLQALTLIGNPIAKQDSEYQTFILAYLSYPLQGGGGGTGSEGGVSSSAGGGGGAQGGAGKGGAGGGTIGGIESLIGNISDLIAAPGNVVTEAANDVAILGAGGTTTGMIGVHNTSVEISRLAAQRGGFISLRGGVTAIRTLAYLDYKQVNIDQILKARELYGEDLAKLEQDDINAEIAKEAIAQLQHQKEIALKANVTGLEGFFQ
ncbi:MAG: putative dynein regulatory complex subunit 3, partial [Streblomastix strix]